MHTVKFHNLGNADCTLINLENKRKILFDYANMRDPNEEDDVRCDLPTELREDLGKRDNYDVVAFSHLDRDHYAGATDFFYFDHIKKYQGDVEGKKRIKMNVMWVPAAAITEKLAHSDDVEAKAIQSEARERFKAGEGIRVFSRPERLIEWCAENGIDFEDRRHLTTDAGKLAPEFTLEDDGVEFFVHSPFAVRQDECTVEDRNTDSLVMQATFEVGGVPTKLMLSSDVGHAVLTDIVRVTEARKNDERLEWDIFKLPHHCSYLTLADEKGKDKTQPVPEVERLFENYSQDGCVVVSTSDTIPEKGDERDTQKGANPPHRQAANYYKEDVVPSKDGEFKATMEHPSKTKPKPLIIDIDGSKATIRKAVVAVSVAASARVRRGPANPMAETFIDPGGMVIPESALKLRRSREVVRAVQARDDLFVTLVECRKAPGVETVILDIEPQRPQVLASPIRKIERVAAVFQEDDRAYPKVLSLRPDFPETLHLNQELAGSPLSFCLYDRPWPEIRVNWTGPTFLERIRWWLAGTARGTLHEDDQPLEPLLLSAGYWLVVPAKLPAAMTPCDVHFVGGPEGTVLVAHVLPARPGARASAPHLLLRFESPPRVHGTSPRTPFTLGDVCTLLAMPGFDLLALLRETLKNWPKDREVDLGAKIVLLIDLPKIATPGGPTVVVDRKAFLTTVDALALGAAVGVWTLDGRKRSFLLKPDAAAGGQSVKIIVTNVTQSLSPDDAAMFNGADESNPAKVLAVGAGGLGSQTILNLARAGFGRWTIIDSDQVLPHNLARHALDGSAVGYHKADAVAGTINSFLDPHIAGSINADILDPGTHTAAVTAALSESGLVLDLSASVPVARHLAHAPGGGRRMSVFLSPSGHDLVMLCEDRQRTLTIDQLEMTYYAAVASDDRLDRHLDPPAGRKRYGLSCRDISSRIAQADVGTFAGVAARAIPQAASQDNAIIRVWRGNPDSGAVDVVDIALDQWLTQGYGEWTIHITKRLLAQIAQWRLERLPRETGGILVGGIDHERRAIYLVEALPSPADSDEWPHMYIRGSEGMRKAAEDILERTAANMLYLGEWHSHPKGYATLPSADDLIVLSTVTEWVSPAGQPGLILIAGDDGRATVLVGSFDPAKPPEELCPA